MNFSDCSPTSVAQCTGIPLRTGRERRCCKALAAANFRAMPTPTILEPGRQHPHQPVVAACLCRAGTDGIIRRSSPASMQYGTQCRHLYRTAGAAGCWVQSLAPAATATATMRQHYRVRDGRPFLIDIGWRATPKRPSALSGMVWTMRYVAVPADGVRRLLTRNTAGGVHREK